MIVGAPGNGIYRNDYGEAYVFVRNGTTWTQQARLLADNRKLGDQFGQSVAVYGNMAAIGIPGLGTTDSGGVYVFARGNNGTWTRQTLHSGEGLAGARLGSNVAIWGNTILSGAPGATVKGKSHQGKAYVHMRNGNRWISHILVASDGQAEDWFGRVALYGNTAVIGAQHGNGGRGAAYVFGYNGRNWQQKAKLIASDGQANDLFGHNIALNYHTVVIGAPWADVYNQSNRGAAYVFIYNGSAWIQEQKLLANDGGAGDMFSRVAVHENTVMVGAFRANTNNRGAVYVFGRIHNPLPPDEMLDSEILNMPAQSWRTEDSLMSDISDLDIGDIHAEILKTPESQAWMPELQVEQAPGAVVPEPGTLSLLALGGIGLLIGIWKRQHQRSKR